MSSASDTGCGIVADEIEPAEQDWKLPDALRILVADDTLVSRVFVTKLLERNGHVVTTVGNGCAAVAEAGAGEFDLVLMDVHMPGMDGLEATQNLRSAGYEAPVFALTATLAPEDASLCMAAGMDACLRKPFDLHELEVEWRRTRQARPATS